jgi:hypothetical protein
LLPSPQDSAIFQWRDEALDTAALLRQVESGLQSRQVNWSAREEQLLAERWTPLPTAGDDPRLTLLFLERFAAITRRMAGGLAHTVVTTLRLERPLRQQEEFNHATLLVCRQLAEEVVRLRQRLAELEER